MLRVKPTDTVMDLKRQIQEKWNIKMEEQVLIFSGKKMKEKDRLQEYPLSNETTLHLVSKVKFLMSSSIALERRKLALERRTLLQTNNTSFDESEEEKKRTTKKCPKCGIIGTHYFNEGCHHITCQNCQFEYCYCCLNSWGPACKREHFFCDVSRVCGCPLPDLTIKDPIDVDVQTIISKKRKRTNNY